MRRLLTTILLLHTCCIALAQVPKSLSSAEIYQGIKKLNVLGSVLYIAAHPDDENTRLLAYLSKEKQYRTGYLSLTRGDGGQNLIGDEQGIELGMIRTQELLAARRVDGAEQFFSRAFDFGFSKTADETLSIWGKEKILSDVVWVIRKFQPDVIITRFPGDSRAGHGHHWSSALLANEAFIAAADPNRFPEHFDYGVKPWQAKRILWNAFNFNTGTAPDSAFKVDVGTFNNILGKGYGEIASESRSNHKSQGFGAARTRGEAFEYFITTGGSEPTQDLFDEVNTGWTRINQTQIQQLILQIEKKFSFEQPFKSLPALVNLHRSLKQLPDDYWKQQKLKEVQQLIESAAGLFADATTNTTQAIQGDSLRITLVVNKRNNVDAQILGYSLDAFDTSFRSTLSTNRNFTIPKNLVVPFTKKLSQPYWLEHSMPMGSFEVRDQQLIGKAENDPAFTVHYRIRIEGDTFIVSRPVQYKFTDPVKGEVYQPVIVLPAWEQNFTMPIYVSRNGKSLAVGVQVKANTKTGGSFKQEVTPVVSEGWQQQAGSVTATLQSEGVVAVSPLKKDVNTRGTISLQQQPGSVYYGSGKTIAYDHIPNITYFSPATSTLVNLDIKTSGKNIGYIPGAGDKVAEAVQSLGYNVKVLSQEDITPEMLRTFDAVITGIRAYNTHLYLTAKYDVLISYVKNGGNLIVQFNTNNGVGPLRAKIGPYNFNVSRTRVTEENADVTFGIPDHSVLNYPNKITTKDFEGWVQERSVYEADQLDSAFVTPIQMSDKNEKPGKGSLIIAKYGKGNFVYTGLSFFRQLPAGVPGAYRLLANLIALPKNK
jgi:LmbE family N-acetylglucosaminyl deacetylase